MQSAGCAQLSNLCSKLGNCNGLFKHVYAWAFEKVYATLISSICFLFYFPNVPLWSSAAER
jgi:hypothetical protein